MGNISWISVFGRDYRGVQCESGAWSALFDGNNDAVVCNTNNHFPGVRSVQSVQNKVVVSMWVKFDWTLSTVGNGGRFIITQNATGVNQGSTDQFFRIAYTAKSGSGNPINNLTVTYRGDGTSNKLEKIYGLDGTLNSSVTGSTSASDYWASDNTNITVNDRGFVNICSILTLPAYDANPAINEPFSAGSLNTYWNGQLLGSFTNNTQGVAQQDTNSVYGLLGANISNLGGLFPGKIDEMQVLSDAFGHTSAFKTAYSLTTDQSIATFFWNDGCPIDTTGHANASSWNYYNYRFENNWNSEGSTTFPMSPANGAIFSTDHA